MIHTKSPASSLEPAPSPIRLSGLAPVINATTHTLILGSFPGVASLAAQQYYGFKHNQFWRLLSAILQQDLTVLPYPDKLVCLLAHGIGIWDTYRSCYREGSLDTAIRQGDLNDFASLQTHHPALQTICFNGKAATKVLQQMRAWGYQTHVLPSSSPAHASLRFEDKLALWRQAFA